MTIFFQSTAPNPKRNPQLFKGKYIIIKAGKSYNYSSYN